MPSTNTNSTMQKINSDEFYNEYHGHKIRHLKKLYPLLRSSSDALIWTAGDSSLDNKYWFVDSQPAVGEYANILDPPYSRCDVTYWLNHINSKKLSSARRKRDGGGADYQNNGLNLPTINTAVEATTLNERSYKLRSQDKFICDHIGSDDILIVSVGGNDVALLPTPCTIAAMGGALCLPSKFVDAGFSCCSLPVDDCCCGCGASLASCAGACPPCLGYFRHMFGTRIQKYIEKITSKTRPKKILVCMIYYLDENVTPSWAGGALRALGYDSNPAKLQSFIRKVFEEATSRISIAGSEVIPVPLFNVLDGKRSEDYVARVEPSAIGGEKMAEFLWDIIHSTQSPSSLEHDAASAPTTSFMSGRT